MFKSGKFLVISLCILIVILGALFAYNRLMSGEKQSSKTITITINHIQKDNRTLKITTKAEFLGQALSKAGLIHENESKSGFLVSSVDGEKANEKQWWGFTKAGEYTNTSIDKTPIKDGDSFEFSLHIS